jgi:hypothetical protein
MHFGGVYVFSEGFASDRRKASRGSTNQNVTGVHRAGRGALWTDISPTTYSYGSDAICTQTRLSMVHADAMPTFSEADNRRSPEPTKVQPHHVASGRTKRECVIHPRVSGPCE